MSAQAELSSVASAIDELVTRVDTIVDGLSEAERDRLSADLFELQRTLSAARRRLASVVDRLG